jgi:Zn-dependent protease
MTVFLDFQSLLFRAPALLVALTVHEYAHACVSDSLGDPTPSMTGRLTLNPLAHLDVIGTIALVLVGFGWAKPVQVDPRYYKNFRSGMRKVAFAGPGSNFLLAFLCVLVLVARSHFGFGQSGMASQFLYWMMLYNVWFGFFNLIPIPPLDGSKIVETFLSYRTAYAFETTVSRYGFWILLIVCYTGLASVILGPLAQGFLSLCFLIAQMIF